MVGITLIIKNIFYLSHTQTSCGFLLWTKLQGGNEMYYCLSFFGGFILCLVIMIQFIKAKEVKEMTVADKVQLKQMKRLKSIRESKE